ncbi:MAG: hypothetical protein M3483_02775 [Gemmatimonadota bacterium]|nr:hypothetical protein [Gemmatimonadota bacterium]
MTDVERPPKGGLSSKTKIVLGAAGLLLFIVGIRTGVRDDEETVRDGRQRPDSGRRRGRPREE